MKRLPAARQEHLDAVVCICISLACCPGCHRRQSSLFSSSKKVHARHRQLQGTCFTYLRSRATRRCLTLEVRSARQAAKAAPSCSTAHAVPKRRTTRRRSSLLCPAETPQHRLTAAPRVAPLWLGHQTCHSKRGPRGEACREAYHSEFPQDSCSRSECQSPHLTAPCYLAGCCRTELSRHTDPGCSGAAPGTWTPRKVARYIGGRLMDKTEHIHLAAVPATLKACFGHRAAADRLMAASRAASKHLKARPAATSSFADACRKRHFHAQTTHAGQSMHFHKNQKVAMLATLRAKILCFDGLVQ